MPFEYECRVANQVEGEQAFINVINHWTAKGFKVHTFQVLTNTQDVQAVILFERFVEEVEEPKQPMRIN